MTKTILLYELEEILELSEEEVKNKIMKEGYPLQRFCAKKLQSLGWTVNEEYPVEQTIPISWNPYGGIEGQLKSVRTSGDIRAIYQKPAKGFAVCIKNEGYEASLETRKIYQTIADSQADQNELIRIVDESGDDYLFPKEYFVIIQLPRSVEKALAINT